MATKKKVAVKNKEKKETTKVQAVAVPVKWNIPDDIITRFATNMVIQKLENEFKVMFFEVKPDIRIDSTSSIQKEVQADCIASIIITADRLPKFIEAFQGQYNQFVEIQTQLMEELKG